MFFLILNVFLSFSLVLILEKTSHLRKDWLEKIDGRLMKDWWKIDERLDEDWWKIDERLDEDWWKIDERLL